MKSELAALWEAIRTETVVVYPDFHFLTGTDKEGNFTIDFRGTWEREREPDQFHRAYLTLKHADGIFTVTHYRWDDRKRYKTLKGAAKYVNSELQDICNRKREQKAKDDAAKEFAQKSVQILRDFHTTLAESGIESKLCLTTDRYNNDHLCVETKRINTSIDITVTSDYRLEMAFWYPRFYASPETAIDILSVIATKGSA